MKKRVIKIVSFLIFMCILAFSIFIASDVLLLKHEPPFRAKNDLRDNCIDIMFFGSSHSFCSILPMQLWNDYGYSSFVYSTSSQSLPNSYNMINLEMKRQSPQIIVLEMHSAGTEAVGGNQELHRSLDAYPLSFIKINAINDLVENEHNRTEYYAPFYLYHSRWDTLTTDDFIFSTSKVNAFSRGAYISRPRHTAFEAPQIVDESQLCDINDMNKEYLNKIIRLCKENECQLILYTAPYCAGITTQTIANSISKIAAENNVAYYNFFHLIDDIGLDFGRDMWDQGHLNIYGMEKMTAYIGRQINQHYYVDSHKDDEEYAFWDEDYLEYSKWIRTYKLAIAADDNDFMQYIDSDNHIILLSGSFADAAQRDRAEALLSQAGYLIDFNDNDIYCAAIIKGKHDINIASGKQPISVSEMIDDVFFKAGTDDGIGVIVGSREQQLSGSGLNIIVYDTITESVVGSRNIQ
ncbi:MAG: hypothetical protein Q4E65_00705 [Clostridia bacterium]|nr:hypothetical protein [Clostridia bacterium]